MNEEFIIGQIFENDYPEEAADWCGENNATIEEITESGAEVRRFQIVEIPAYVPTKAELTAFVSAEADKVAYGGFTILSDGQEYLFKTTTDNITRCNSVLAMFQVLPEGTIIPWEVWQGDVPTMLAVNAEQFKACFAFGSGMIINVETVKGTLNAEIQQMSESQLEDAAFVAAFKENVIAALGEVNTIFELPAAQ